MPSENHRPTSKSLEAFSHDLDWNLGRLSGDFLIKYSLVDWQCCICMYVSMS